MLAGNYLSLSIANALESARRGLPALRLGSALPCNPLSVFMVIVVGYPFRRDLVVLQLGPALRSNPAILALIVLTAHEVNYPSVCPKLENTNKV